MKSLEIPLPPIALRSQNHGSWRSRCAAVKLYRDEVAALAMAMPKIQTPCVLHHEWYLAKTLLEQTLGVKCPKAHRRYRPLDEQNAIAALKAAIDGIVDARRLDGDDYKRLRWGEYSRYGERKRHQGRACVVLTFEEVGE